MATSVDNSNEIVVGAKVAGSATIIADDLSEPVSIKIAYNNPELTIIPVVSTKESKDIVSDISELIDFAKIKLVGLGETTFSPDQYGAGVQKLKELRLILDSFDLLLARSNAALHDEKAQLMKRLEEIRRVMNPIGSAPSSTPSAAAPSPAQLSWADKTEEDEKRYSRRNQPKLSDSATSRRGNSPVDFDSYNDSPNCTASRQSLDTDIDAQKRRQARNHRSRGRGGNIPSTERGLRNGGWNGPDKFHGDCSSDDQHPADKSSEIRRIDPRGFQKPVRPQGSRIPQISSAPLKRLVVMDDIEGFAMIVKQDTKYGQLITFAPPFEQVLLGGIIEVVSDRQSGKQNMCEPLYLEGMCNCSTSALTLHAGRPLQIGVVDFIAILHKFVNNYSGNRFHPHDSAKNYVDAIILRCVIHAIVQIKGIRRGQLVLTIASFAEATEPRNLLNAIGDYYHKRSEVDPMAVARGLFTALATHFVSS